MNWSLSAEGLAIILIIMTALFYHNREQVKSRRRRFFESSMCLAGSSIVLNAVCVFTIDNYDCVPHWLNNLLNNAYFLVSVWTCTMIASYLFNLLLEHVYRKDCSIKARAGLGVLSGVYTAVVLSNYWTGWLFWFGEDGKYHRGSLNLLGYVILVLELAMLIMCYIRNRASVSKKVIRVMRTLPPIVLLLAVFQMAYPAILLNGTIMTFALLIIFVNFQNFQVEKDSLTGVGSRKSFFEELCLRLRGGQQFQVIMISLNDFAVLNQQFGYRKGDEFLYHISKWLREFSQDGRVFRFGNVTFALSFPYVSEAQSQEILDRISARFVQPWSVGEINYKISARLGMMNCTETDREATQVVEQLAFMMETAKKRDLCEVKMDAEMEELFKKEKTLKLLLETAIEKHRFEVWYQPVCCCHGRKPNAAEALLRLQDDNGDMVSPDDFIPLAESTGLIDAVGWFVLEEVCRFLGEHPELPFEYISVNMSMQQFMDTELCEKITACLLKNGVMPNRLKLEITERVILYDMNYMKQQMERFAKAGIHFLLDDFGTGYSNFSTVLHLPFEAVKLDRSLMDGLHCNEKSRMAASAMVTLFHNLGFKVVAEGIETEEQKAIVREFAADCIQGFCYARPMRKQALLLFLENNK